MSLTPSTVNECETEFNSDDEYDVDDDDLRSVEAQFGDASSVGSLSVHSIADQEDAGKGKLSDSDDSHESVNDVICLQYLMARSDDTVDGDTDADCTAACTGDQLQDSESDGEKREFASAACAMTVLHETYQLPPKTALHANCDNVNLTTLRCESMERTALWCATNTAMTSLQSADRCLTADVHQTDWGDDDPLHFTTDTDVLHLTAAAEPAPLSVCQHNDKSIPQIERAPCGSRAGKTHNNLQLLHSGLCGSGMAASDIELLAGSGHWRGVTEPNEMVAPNDSCTAAVSLPLVEDGLSSGHASDEDDNVVTACACSESEINFLRRSQMSADLHSKLAESETGLQRMSDAVNHTSHIKLAMYDNVSNYVEDDKANTSDNDDGLQACCDGNTNSSAHTGFDTLNYWIAAVILTVALDI